MSSVLSSEDFGKKLYQTLPPMYREDDSKVNFALKRYLEALADGGFAKVIDEINNLMTLVDPNKIQSDLLPILYMNYGLEIFHGIPESYLRKLLPLVSKLFSFKGSTTAVEFLTTTITGLKSTIETSKGIDNIEVRIELDFDNVLRDKDNVFPDKDQLMRIMKEFLPFFCDLTIIYVYFFFETFQFDVEEEVFDVVQDFKKEESGVNVKDFCTNTFNEFTKEVINLSRYDIKVPDSSKFEIGAPFGEMLFNRLGDTIVEVHKDYIKEKCVKEENRVRVREKLYNVAKYISSEERNTSVEDLVTTQLNTYCKEIVTVSKSVTEKLGVSYNTAEENSVLTPNEECVTAITQPPIDYAVFNKNTFGFCLFGNDTKETIYV